MTAYGDDDPEGGYVELGFTEGEEPEPEPEAAGNGADRDERPLKYLITWSRDFRVDHAKPFYRIQGLLPREGLALFWGPPKCGKTFVAFDLSMHIALGWDYRGRRVEQGNVLYAAAEGDTGLRARNEAWRQEKLSDQHSGDIPLGFLATRLVLAQECDALIRDITQQIGNDPQDFPAVIVIDTLNRTIGGSENDRGDMVKFIIAADKLWEKFHCCVVIIHHCGIDGNRPRGHSSLTAAVDAQFAVTKNSAGNVVVNLEYLKGGPADITLESALRVVSLGLDNDRNEITSCVLDHLDGDATSPSPHPGKAKPKLSDKDQITLDALCAAISAHGKVAPGHNY
jgi:hypothetical protein